MNRQRPCFAQQKPGWAGPCGLQSQLHFLLPVADTTFGLGLCDLLGLTFQGCTCHHISIILPTVFLICARTKELVVRHSQGPQAQPTSQTQKDSVLRQGTIIIHFSPRLRRTPSPAPATGPVVMRPQSQVVLHMLQRQRCADTWQPHAQGHWCNTQRRLKGLVLFLTPTVEW